MVKESTIYSSNKRIVLNTIVLYIRMLFVLCLNLYISRLILKDLGIVDYGIYNIVGGIVVLFSYMNSALNLASNRFFSYEMKNGISKMNVVFNTCFNIQLVFCGIIILLGETVGLWLVNYKLVIPADRMFAANCVYQFSLLTTLLSILRVPYESSIITHERMSIFAVLSIVEVLLKLVLVLLLPFSVIDVLASYSGGLLIISLICFLLRILYCKRHFIETKLRKVFDKTLFKEMFAFTGWNFFGATAGVSVSQGLNFILNIFFGPTVNAARGIAMQVEGAVNQFVTSINTAVNPQIIKRYSIDDRNGMLKLVFFASKISFLLLLVISFPILIDTEYILRLWLGNVPEKAVIFTRLELIYMLSVSMTYSINMSAQATGQIRLFQFVEGSILILNLPIAYILYVIGFPPEVAFYSLIGCSLSAFFSKLLILRRIMSFPLMNYVKQVFVRVVVVSAIGYIVFCFLNSEITIQLQDFIARAALYTMVLMLACWFVGFSKNDKHLVYKYINQALSKIIKK